MQHKWIGVLAEFGHDEGHALCHKASDKGDIAKLRSSFEPDAAFSGSGGGGCGWGRHSPAS